ncbi:adenylyl-sulfate kinase [Paraflavisolibacter sp. H34]|uniref:adenylyl-sulfate kinase n=1 Tax=Huijunlia imazamoxiresistens TaxID=3127457 RepID=UPI0030177D9D
MIIQFCGLSGSGKTTLAQQAKEYFQKRGMAVEVIDGDEYRKQLCSDLGFGMADRMTNIRRLAFVAGKLAQYGVLPIICAINPYEEVRQEVAHKYPGVKTVYIKCSLEELIRRDTKGLYAKALLPQHHADRIHNLSGINDPFEIPSHPDLVIATDKETLEVSLGKLVGFIERHRHPQTV